MPAEGVEPLAGSFLSPGRLLPPVEIGPGLDQYQAGPFGFWDKLDGRQGYGRDCVLLGEHRRVDDTLVCDDLAVERLPSQCLAVVDSSVPFDTSGTEVQFVVFGISGE